MANSIERRRTVTRTVSTEGADQLKANISNIAEELARVRDQARSEVDALEKIRGMLDVSYLNSLLESVEELETRMEVLENDSLQSQNQAERYRLDLEQEQERLAKLWDAYKTQEDELDRIKRDYPLMEEKLFERERSIENLRREIARIEPLTKYKGEFDAAVAENKQLQAELGKTEIQLERAERTIKEMEDEVASLRQLEGMRGRVGELEAQLEEEQERMAKLYKVYEELESEKKDVESMLGDWEAWFRRVQPGLKSVCEGFETAPGLG